VTWRISNRSGGVKSAWRKSGGNIEGISVAYQASKRWRQ